MNKLIHLMMAIVALLTFDPHQRVKLAVGHVTLTFLQ